MKEANKKILLVIQDAYLMFLCDGLFRTRGFLTSKAKIPKSMQKALENNRFDLIILGMFLNKKAVEVLVFYAMLHKTPILVIQMHETKNLLEEYLKYDQYIYVDILNDELKDIIKKAKKIMAKYKAVD